MVQFKQLSTFLCLISFSLSQAHAKFPIRISTTLSTSKYSQVNACSTATAINDSREKINETLLDLYNATFPCSCGGIGGWTRVAYLNMSDSNQQCPSNWRLTTSPVRGCGRSSNGYYTCDSVIYPVNGRTYSSVCGRIKAYQKGVGAAFYRQTHEIDISYVTGVSITHGEERHRQHIWTFATAYSYDCNTHIQQFCPCTNINVNWNYRLPSFINEDYFCESGQRSVNGNCYGSTTMYYTEDPLWDGKGCPASSTCCDRSSTGWFCKTLQQATSDDLEVRQCHINTKTDEDTLISLVEIYVN